MRLLTLTPAVASSAAQAQGKARYNRVTLMDALEHLSTQLSAISGAQGDRMTRDEAWRLLFAGRHIERVWAMSTILRVVASEGQLATPAGFDLLLQLFDSTLTYRSLYPGRFEVPALLDLLVIEPTNPRGLYGVYERLCTKLDDISIAAGSTRHRPFNDLLPAAGSLPSLERLCSTDARGTYVELIRVLRPHGGMGERRRQRNQRALLQSCEYTCAAGFVMKDAPPLSPPLSLLSVSHRTTYHYSTFVETAQHLATIRPLSCGVAAHRDA